jgi:hypothetical protein
LATRPRVARIGKSEVALDEVLGVRAVRRDPNAEPDIAALTTLYPALTSEIEHLAGAGWSFVDGEPIGSAQVFVRDGARVWLANGEISIKFEDDVDEPRIEAMLATEGLVPVKRVGRLPRPRRAVPMENRTVDAIDAADRLRAQPGVVFAEPAFIQAIGPR